MSFFTKQERFVLAALCMVIVAGSFFRYAFKRYAKFEEFILRFEADTAFYQVDVNRASVEELIAVPFIGAYTAGEIVRYRELHGEFRTLEDLKAVKGIKEKNYQKFAKYLKASRRRAPR